MCVVRIHIYIYIFPGQGGYRQAHEEQRLERRDPAETAQLYRQPTGPNPLDHRDDRVVTARPTRRGLTILEVCLTTLARGNYREAHEEQRLERRDPAETAEQLAPRETRHPTGNSNSHGARPVHQIISMLKWIRISKLSIKNSLSLGGRLWTRRTSCRCTPRSRRSIVNVRL